jgi:hypothetical protein
MLISKDMWEAFCRSLSAEALGDEFDSPPSGGNADGDAEMNGGNEQLHEGGFADGFSNDFGGGDDFGMGGSGLGGPGMDGMSGGQGSGLGTSLNPAVNPFKGQNGRTLLDTKFAELYAAVNNSLELAQADIKIDTVVVGGLTELLAAIEQVREVVFIQPVESSLYRWRLCVKAYELISKQLSEDIKAEQEQSN